MAEGEVVAPVETPVAATEATPVPNPTAGQVDETQPPEADPPEKMLPQSEVNKLIAKEKAKEARRTERAIRAEVERDLLRQQLEARDRPQTHQTPQGDPEPNEEDYRGKPYRDFLKAQARWEIRQELKADRERQTREGQQTQQTQRVQQQAQYVHERLMAKGQEKYPDFDERVLADDVPITPAMVAVAAKLDNGYDVLYQLVNNEAELTRISRLSDIEQSWELRDFSNKLKASPKPTQTPPPIVPTGSKASVEKRLQDANIDEFFAIRKKQIAAKRGR